MSVYISTGISGTVFSNLVEQEINNVELLTSSTIDSSAIPEKYQYSICKFSQASLLSTNDSQENEDNVKLGDLSVSTSAGGTSSIVNSLKEDAYKNLRKLQSSIKFKRVIGC